MPFLWHDVLRGDQLDGRSIDVSIPGAAQKYELNEGRGFTLRILWHRGCFVGMQVNHLPPKFAFVDPPDPSRIEFGHGYLNRYWDGAIQSVDGRAYYGDRIADVSMMSVEAVSP
jgi:hypothetical protein